jgi:23S rRNA (adenine2503-C2)-methyltransferase
MNDFPLPGEPDARPALSGFPPEELARVLAPLPSYRAKQIFKWIARGAASFEEMTNLPRTLRDALPARFRIFSCSVAARLDSPDGTVKLQIRLKDGAMIEAVLLSDESEGGVPRKTACLSTQAGCPAGCVFCKTGSLGFLRSLEAAEIVEQFLLLGNIAGDISNIVVMGMGEPLLNLGELRRALAVLTCREGLGLSPRRITLSSCGIAGGIRDLADKGPPVRLALSLTTARDDLRQRLMPLGKSNPLPAVREALRYFQQKGGGRVTLEAVLLSGINTRREDAEALIAFAEGLDVVVNLIPWNPVEGLEFEGKPLREPPARETEEFTRRLLAGGLKVTRRFRRGRSVQGACGQLGALRLPEEPGEDSLGKTD